MTILYQTTLRVTKTKTKQKTDKQRKMQPFVKCFWERKQNKEGERKRDTKRMKETKKQK
jgi:hypothetical protein